MILRILAAILGLAVVGAATHLNVMHAGGYQSGEAFLIITVAGMLGVGMGYAATVWRDRSKIGATALVLCLLAGETYWLLQNTERELQSRADIEAPLAAQREARRKAEQRIADAKEAKHKADSAALEQAALPACRKNCADLLTAAVNTATTELANAQAALALLPRAASSAVLADNIGMPRWAWDLIMGGLRGLAVFGGSIAFALAAHPHRHAAKAAKVETLIVEPARAAKPPRPRKTPHSSPLAIIARPINEREHVSHFLRIAVRPDPNAETSLRQLNDRYPGWCREQSVDPLPPAQLGQQLRSIIDAIGLECVPTGRDVIIRGAALN
jgi:hypothetical protein